MTARGRPGKNHYRLRSFRLESLTGLSRRAQSEERNNYLMHFCIHPLPHFERIYRIPRRGVETEGSRSHKFIYTHSLPLGSARRATPAEETIRNRPPF